MSAVIAGVRRFSPLDLAQDRAVLALTVVILVVALAVRIPLLWSPLTYSNDAWRESDTASIARHFVRNGFQVFYPQVYWGGTGPGYVGTEFELYPLIVAGMYALWGEHLIFGRLVSLVFFTLFMLVLWLFAQKRLGPQPTVWTMLLVAFSPLSIRYSVAYMPEAILLFFFITGLFVYCEWLDTRSRTYYVLCIICTATAILIKPTAMILGIVFIALAARKWGARFLRRPAIWLMAALCILPGVAWYWHAHSLFLRYGNTFGILEGDTKFGDLSYWLAPSFYLSTGYIELKWIFGGLAIVPCIVGLVLAARSHDYPVITWGSVALVIYYLLIARASEKWYSVHYHLPALPLAGLAFGLGMQRLWQERVHVRIARSVGVLSIVSLLVVSGAFYRSRVGASGNAWALAQNACGREVSALVPPHAPIVVSSLVPSQEHGRPRNYQDPVIFFSSDRYGWSLPEDWHDPAHVAELRRQGAEFMVIPNSELLANHGGLANYLAAEATQIGPGVDALCGIYAFH